VPKDALLKQVGTLAKTCKRKTTNIQFLEHTGTEKTHFHQSRVIETITKSCNFESTQNALDTKPWRGCRNNNLAAVKEVKVTGVIAGAVTLFLDLLGQIPGLAYHLRPHEFQHQLLVIQR